MPLYKKSITIHRWTKRTHSPLDQGDGKDQEGLKGSGGKERIRLDGKDPGGGGTEGGARLKSSYY